MSEFNEFKPRLKSLQNRFQLSAGLNLEKFNTILSRANHIWAAAEISALKFGVCSLFYLLKIQVIKLTIPCYKLVFV